MTQPLLSALGVMGDRGKSAGQVVAWRSGKGKVAVMEWKAGQAAERRLESWLDELVSGQVQWRKVDLAQLHSFL